MEVIRQPAVAGAFYPDNPKELQKMIADFLAAAKPPAVSGRLRALIVPHAGYVYSGPVAAVGYKLISNLKSKISKLILLGPAHTVGFAGAATSSATAWVTPLGQVKTWQPKNLETPFFEFDVAHLQEHCLEVQLPFLQSVFKDKDFKIFPVVMGDTDSEEVAAGLEKLIDDETLIIVSSDLSHYHPYKQAQGTDKLTVEAIVKGLKTILEVQGEACGLTPILTLMHLARLKNWQAKLLDYRNSGDTFGDKYKVVGYASIVFSE